MRILCGWGVLLAVLALLQSCSWWLNEAPIAILTVDPVSGSAPLSLQLSASQSYDPDGDLLQSFVWELDDVPIGWTETCNYTITTPGEYSLQLTVEDDNGVASTREIVVVVFPKSAEHVSEPVGPDGRGEVALPSGVSVSIQTDPADQTVLSLVEYRQPPQPAGGSGSLLVACSIDLQQQVGSEQAMWSRNRNTPPVKATLSFALADLPPSFAVAVVRLTEDGWVLCPDIAGPGGGALSADGAHIAVALDHLSDYGIYGWSESDMRALLDSKLGLFRVSCG